MPEGYWSPPGNMQGRKGDVDSVALYQVIGKAISAWGLAEERVAWLFWLLATCEGSRPVRTPIMMTWGAMESITPRVELTRQIAKDFLQRYPNAFQMGKINNLLEHVKRASWIRNDIAHGIVMSYSSSGAAYASADESPEVTLDWLIKRPREPEMYCLKAPFFATVKNDYFSEPDIVSGTSRNSYTFSDISTFIWKFLILGGALLRTITEIGEQLSSAPKP